jgi:CRP-like cAMP-binding protein
MEQPPGTIGALSEEALAAWEDSMFARFPTSAASALLAQAHLVSVGEEEVLHAGEGEQGAPLGLIVAGLVRTFLYTAEDRQATLRYIGPGSVLGIPAALDAYNSMVRAETCAPTSLIRLPARRFRSLVQSDSAVAWEVTQYLLHQFAETERMLAANVFLPVGARIASHLLDLAERDGAQLVVSASHQEIADAAGSVREVVSRKLKQMQDAGIVLRLEDRRIALLDAAALHELALGARATGRGVPRG